MSTTIKIKCIEQTLQIINTPKIASGVQQVNKMQFEFCPTWNGFAKTAIFYRNENEVYNVLLANDECVIPSEVLHDQGRFYFGVFGIKDNLRLTSEVLKYDVVKGSFILGQDPEEPTPGIYEQLLTQYGIIEAKYNEINEVYKNIYGDLAGTVANMPAKGFVNVNTGGEVVRFWVGTQAEYEALESIENGVHYVITDQEYIIYQVIDVIRDSDGYVQSDFDFGTLTPENAHNYIIRVTSDEFSPTDTKEICYFKSAHSIYDDGECVLLYENERVSISLEIATSENGLVLNENYIELRELASKEYVSEYVNEKLKATSEVTTITESGLYNVAIGNQAGEYYNIVMYIDVTKDCYSSAVKFYYKGEYYDVWLYYSSGSLTLQYDSSELKEAFTGLTITRLLGV